MTAVVQRWTAARKEALLVEIRTGRLTRDQAIVQHDLSAEELEAWESRFARHGQPGLATRRLQELRP